MWAEIGRVLVKNNRSLLNTKDKRLERRERYYKMNKKQPLKFERLSEKERMIVTKNKERVKKETQYRLVTLVILIIVLFATICIAIAV